MSIISTMLAKFNFSVFWQLSIMAFFEVRLSRFLSSVFSRPSSKFSSSSLMLFHTPPPHSYCLARGFLFFLAGISFLVLTACAGGSGGDSAGSGGNGGSLRPLEVNLTFTPMPGGFRISNQSDFGDFVSLNITAESDGGIIMRYLPINIDQFIDSIYTLDGLTEANWTFEIVGILSDGSARDVTIDFTWEENKDDHNNGGIRTGINTDGDGRADSVDDNDDNDGRLDHEDNCPVDANDDQLDTDGDQAGDACDADDDNDGLDDVDEPEGCELNSDCDNDGLDDGDEAAGCVENADCDSDTIGDGEDACPTGETNWMSNPSHDNDGDGCRDADEDIDDDGDGLIEIETAAELDSVRYALNGNGSKSSENAAIDTTGCGGDGGITSCAGYELVANISLATYADDEGGKGWRPLGHDTDGSRDGCQGTAFDGTFEGNGWTISDLNISRSGGDCVGLFGHIAADATIRNLRLSAERVIGRARVGGLVGDGDSARIVSSSVVVDKVRGNDNVGGLVGWGNMAQIVSSSVVAAEVSGNASFSFVGGLTGVGSSAQIISSSIVIKEIRGNIGVGGLVGFGQETQIISSSVVAAEVSGTSQMGGLAGWGNFVQIAYSYVVSGSDTAMPLVGFGVGGTGVASYWDSGASGINTDNHGEAKTSDDLRTPTGYKGIYATWDDGLNIDEDPEIEDITKWCDRDNSGTIEEDEQTIDNLIWDFGDSDQYPAIRCIPISPTEWRGWWSLDGDGKPQLDQNRLDEVLYQ